MVKVSLAVLSLGRQAQGVCSPVPEFKRCVHGLHIFRILAF